MQVDIHGHDIFKAMDGSAVHFIGNQQPPEPFNDGPYRGGRFILTAYNLLVR
jgi:hypothetical protein